MLDARELVQAQQCGKPSCQCAKGNPVHCANPRAHRNGDAHPSMTVSQGRDGVVFHCQKSCTQEEIIAALTERGLWGGSQPDSSPSRAALSQGNERLVAVYPYMNAAGDVVAEKGRFEAAGVKTFRWRMATHERWGGLEGMQIHDLPLYGLVDLLATTDRVYFVEGEKAADACIREGLVAVCCGGGANQQTFGNQLDPLRERDVVLWPDNDEPGAAFMARLATLLPNARYVHPVLPEKGDAFDYFAGGGTVAGLDALLTEVRARVAILGEATIIVDVPQPNGSVHLEFANISNNARNHTTEAEMTVVVNLPDKSKSPYRSRINLQSSSGRSAARLELERIFPGKDIPWTALLAEATTLAWRTHSAIDHSRDLGDVAETAQREWVIDRMVPKGVTTIIFGMGGGGKSFTVADIGLHVLYGEAWKGRATQLVTGVLVIDYEDTIDEWRMRLRQLCDGYGWPMPSHGFRYMPGRAIPLADQYNVIKEIVEKEAIELVIVDSAVSAVGGDIIDSEGASRLINALQSLGVTSIVIAHQTKAEDDRFPMGSIMWHNLVRATHYLDSDQEPGERKMNVTLHNRKNNRGLQRPINMRITFPEDDDGPVSIETMAVTPPTLETMDQSQRWLVTQMLDASREPMTAADLAKASNVKVATVRGYLSKGNGTWCMPAPGMDGYWVATREQA